MKAATKIKALSGKSFPLGATPVDGGVNFAVYSRTSQAMDLVLFPQGGAEPPQIIQLDPSVHKTYAYWHAFVPGIKPGQEYGFRAHGPYEPWRGQRFDGQKLLLDPYAKAVTGWSSYNREKACKPGENIDCSLRSVVIDHCQFDWGDDHPPRHSFAETVIYELHVGGFTRHSSSNVEPNKRGAFAGLIEKIPHLVNLGVTAVELMPVQEFDPISGTGLPNYWGYNTIGFFAPHHGFCIGGDPVSGVDEFKSMVKALHQAGIEVILDVVFNHTAEGNENGPTLSFRGLENSSYYLLEPNDRSAYSNFAGCGNSFNGNHPVVGKLVLDSLRYWVTEMHVDGFRFDLAAALARDVDGTPMDLPPLLWAIECDPVLAGTKLIAEAWDAAGLYRVGWFVNTSNWYAEWNGPFRDDVRKFVRSDSGSVGALASRIAGSADLYPSKTRNPNRSINFITCHDGFTLRDLVSYNSKHNQANLESNRDGADANFSWNCGAEGDSKDPQVNALRLRQMKNLLATLFVSQGTPMILMGDELGRSQGGNNNAYCHDNELTWLDWSFLETNAELFRFTQSMISFTQSLQLFKQHEPLQSEESEDGTTIAWHGTRLHQPDWSADSHSIAFTLQNKHYGERLHIMLNSYWEELTFAVPSPAPGHKWQVVADTSCDGTSPAGKITGSAYTTVPRSIVILHQLPG